MPPTVSVVIPAYNAEATIGATIQSVLCQTFDDLEIIVVDDGSSDTTADQVKKCGDRVRFIQQLHKGVAAARNRGLAEVQGHYVAFLDADDLWLSHKLEIQLSIFRHDPQIQAVQCSVYLVNNHLEVVGANYCDPDYDSLLDFLFFRNLAGISSTLLIRTERMKAVDGFAQDLVILEDWDLACRLARCGGFRSLADCLVLYRQHSRNRSRDIGIHVEPGFRSLNRLFADPTLDAAIRRREDKVWARFFAMLAGGYAQNKQWMPTLYWAWRAFQRAPPSCLDLGRLAPRRLRKRIQPLPRLSFAAELPFAVL